MDDRAAYFHTLVPTPGVSRCRARLAWWRTATAHSRDRSPSRLAASRGLRAVMRGGSGRRGAALVPDDGDRFPLGEPGAGGDA